MNKSRLRHEIIKELYGTSLKFLYEQAPPVDPAAPPVDPAAPPVDPAAPPVDPAAPPVDPALAAPPAVAPVPVTPAAVPGMPPMPGMPPVPGAAPAVPVKKPIVHADIKGAIGRYLEKAEQKAIGAEAESVESGNVGERVSRSLRNRSMSFLL